MHTRHAGAALGVLAVFLVVAGARLWLIASYGSSTPFLDQWNGEAGAVYVPYLEGRLTWANLLAPHNVHRIVLTRIEALLLLAANGQWDAQLQMVVNAGIQAATTAVLVWLMWTLCGRRHLADIGVLACLVFASPIAWENTLAGFQSQFYFLNLTAIIGLWALPFARPLSPRWLVGLAALVLGLFTMASGVIAPVAAALVVGLHHAGERRLGRQTVISLVACLSVAAAGWLLLPLQTDDLPSRARALAPFADYLTRALAWPFVDNRAMAGAMWAPSVILAIRVIWTRAYQPAHAYLAGLGAWVVAHALSAAIAQGRDGGAPAWRYMDILAIGPVLNGTALALLLDNLRQPRYVRLATLAAAVWAVWLVVRVDDLSRRVLETEVRGRQGWTTLHTRNIRQFSADHDLDRFSRLHFPVEIPWPDARTLAEEWLYHPSLRRVLPASIRDPLDVHATGPTAFVTPGTAPGASPSAHPHEASLGSYGTGGAATEGEFRSQSLQCDVGAWLRFDVAGPLGQPGTSLVLEAADEPPRVVLPGAEGGDRWQPAFARCPAGPFQVVGRDASPTAWFAFAPPVEVGSLSRWAEVTAQNGRGVFITGLLIAAAATLVSRRAPRG